MAYCAVADVEMELKNVTFSTTSLVTIATVQAWINEADALINSYIGMKYQTPVPSSTDAALLCGLWSKTLVADRVKKKLTVLQQQAGKDAAQSFGMGSGLTTKIVMDQLEQVKDASLRLDGALPLLTASVFASGNVDNCVKPVFRKGEQQW